MSRSDYVRQRSQGATIRQKITPETLQWTSWGQRSIADLHEFLDVRCGGVMGGQLWGVNLRVEGLERRFGWAHLWSDKVSVSRGHVSFTHPRDLFVHAPHQAKIYGCPPHQWPHLSKGLGGPELCTFAVENKQSVLEMQNYLLLQYSKHMHTNLFPLIFK